MRTFIFIFAFCALTFSESLWGVAVLVKARKKNIQPLLLLSATINPKRSETIKIGFNSILTSIKVKLGQRVQAGELIATSDTEYFTQEKEYLNERYQSVLQDQKQVQLDFENLKKRQRNLNALAAKDIIPRVQAENFQLNLLDMRKNIISVDESVKSLKELIEQIDKKIRESNYFSPISGIVSALIIDPRQFMGSLSADYDAVLAKIDEPFRFSAVIQALDTQVVKIKKGQKAQIQLEGTSQFFEGFVTEINSMADPKTQLFKVMLDFKKDGEPIPAGLTARVIFKDGPTKTALTLPWNAVQVSGDMAWVTPSSPQDRSVATNGTSGTKKPVKLGMRTADQVEILEGIREGEWVEASLW